MSNIKELLRKMVREALAEAETAPAKPETKPTVAPGKPGEKPKPRRPLGNPDVKPNPKAMNEEGTGHESSVGKYFDIKGSYKKGDGSVAHFDFKNVKLVNPNGRVFEKPSGGTIVLPTTQYQATAVDKGLNEEEVLNKIVARFKAKK